MNSWSFKWKQSHPLNLSNIYIYSCRDLKWLISSYVFFFLVLPTSSTNVGLNITLYLWKHRLHSDINLNISRGSQANQRKTHKHFRQLPPQGLGLEDAFNSNSIHTNLQSTNPTLSDSWCARPKAGSKHSLKPKPIMLPSPARWWTAERLRKSIVLLQERMKRIKVVLLFSLGIQ